MFLRDAYIIMCYFVKCLLFVKKRYLSRNVKTFIKNAIFFQKYLVG